MSAVRRAKYAASVALRHAWRMVILVVGLTVLAVGVALIVLPGPAFVVIPIGLGILATEFAWARHLLHAARDRARAMVNGLVTNSPPNGGTNGDASGSRPDRIDAPLARAIDGPLAPAVTFSFQPDTSRPPAAALRPGEVPRV